MRQPEHPRSAGTRRSAAGIALLYSWPGCEPPKPLTVTSATRPGITTSQRDEQLREGGDQRRALGGVHVLCGQGSLDLGEVRRPVAEREHEAEPEDG